MQPTISTDRPRAAFLLRALLSDADCVVSSHPSPSCAEMVRYAVHIDGVLVLQLVLPEVLDSDTAAQFLRGHIARQRDRLKASHLAPVPVLAAPRPGALQLLR